MMLADNLDVRLADIDASLSPAELRRQTGQLTGGSISVRSLWEPIRVISAEMRARLATAGADYFGVPAHTVRTEDTHVVATDGRKVAYGTIAPAAQLKAPQVAPVPKPLDQLKVIGTPDSRTDARQIVTGRMPYAMDLTVEGALPTVMALPPTAGARFVSVDDAAARAMPGVVAVTRPGRPDILIGAGVAVTAQTFGQAIKARDALNVTWTEGPWTTCPTRKSAS